MKFIRLTAVPVLILLSAMLMGGCAKVEEPDYREQDYGHVQFKLYKASSYPTAKAAYVLDYLHDATKIKVNLRYGDVSLSQTLVLNSSDEESAEFGLRSDKLKLLSGNYRVTTFSLYDKTDKVICEITPKTENAAFTVISGGLVVHDLLADVTPRGKVRFTLVKDMSGFTETPQVKAVTREYTFDEITKVTLKVRSANNVVTEFKNIPAKCTLDFSDNDDPTDGYRTSYSVCDTLLSLPAGDYVIDSYEVFDTDRNLLELNTKVSASASASFSVSDNEITEADVPVSLYETDAYIRDYYALYEIWKSLNGEDWYYSGEDYTDGINWNFNKDPDLWGDQPGVSLHSNGRVALINISDFGFYGELPDAIGQLSELVELYLGTHNDNNQLEYDPTIAEQAGSRDRMARHSEYLHLTHPVTQFSEPIARALAEHDIKIREVGMYEDKLEDEIIDRGTGRMRVQPKDVIAGKYCNGLTSISKEIGKLKKLEKLYIANGRLTSLPEEMNGLEALTDLEVYNCQNMTEFPSVVAQMPALISLNLSNNPQWKGGESDAGLSALATGKAGEKIQILYMNDCGLSKVDGEDISNMKSLGLLDLANNEIESVTAFGSDINITQMYLDNNRITELKHGDGRKFCGIEDIETFSVTNNRLTTFPDIFNAESKFRMASVDFSNNLITSFDTSDGKYDGINVSTLSMTNNPIEVYPVELAESNSKVSYVNMRGCKLTDIPEEALEYENSEMITSLDLSYNRLTKLPDSFHAGNMPYLYGLELSYNAFAEFPWLALDSAYLTAFAIRGQRDDNGARCLSEWPTGIYQHKGLRGFYIGSNNLGKIDDTISTLCYYLDISDNPEIVFDASDVCSAWYYGYYILIYDKTQDIRNCDYMLK